MSYPADRRYTKDHEWVKIEGETALVGITDFAQSELGELVFVDLPAVGRSIAAHATLCVVESTKAASDVYSPVAGTVSEVNTALAGDAALINREPHSGGWIVRLSSVDATAVDSLMDAAQYTEYLAKR